MAGLQTQPGDYSKEVLQNTKLEQNVWLGSELHDTSTSVDQFVKKMTEGKADEWILRVTPDSAQLIAYQSLKS